MPMVLDPDALRHLQAAGGPPAPTQLHQQTYTYYSSPNIFERTLWASPVDSPSAGILRFGK